MNTGDIEYSHHQFDVIDSEDIYEGAIMAVRRDKVRMPHGKEAYREVVEHFGAVAVVALDRNNRILMEHQYRYPVGTHLWELPAGILDIAGENPLHAAQRELYEETGTKAASWKIIADTVTSPGFADETVRIFLAQDLVSVERPAAEDEEADMTLHWFSLPRALEMVFAGDIVNSIAVAGILGAAHLLGVSISFSPRPADAPWPIRGRKFAQRKASHKEQH